MFSTKKTLTLKGAQVLMDAAVAEAARLQVPGAIAIVDDGGHPMLLVRLDDTMVAAANIALGKAATAVAFQRPTIELEKTILSGRTPMLVLNSATDQAYVPLKGGYPIRCGDQVVGGIAVAGTLDAEKDELVARAGLQALVAATADRNPR